MGCSGECKGGVTEKAQFFPENDQELWADDEINANADRERSHYKQGYVDGLTQGKEQSLQDGFDSGFPLGAKLGLRVGKILAQLKSVDEELYLQARQELNIKNVLNKQYFGEDLSQESHELVEKWEKICESKLRSLDE